MKKFLRKTLFVTLSGLLLFSCSDIENFGYNNSVTTDNPLKDVSVPGDFDWKTMSIVDFGIQVNDEYDGQFFYLVEVYDENPIISKTARLITKGVSKKGYPFEMKTTIPNYLTNVYIRQTAPTGLVAVRCEEINNGKVSCDFSKSYSSAKRANANVIDNNGDIAGTIDVPEVNLEDRDLFPLSAPSEAQVIVGAGGWKPKNSVWEVNSQTTAINNYGEDVSFYVTEDATVSSFSSNKRRRVYILPGKTLTVNADVEITTGGLVTIGEGAKLIVNGKLKPGSSRVYNLGTINTTTYQSIGADCFLYNTGEMNVSGTVAEALHIDTQTAFYNLNSLNVEGGWRATSSGVIYNGPAGNAKIGGLIEVNSINNLLINDGNIECGNYTSRGSAKTQNNGSMLVAGKTHLLSKEDLWHNNGIWETGTMEVLAKSSNYINGCKLIVYDNLSISEGLFTNKAGAFVQTNTLTMKKGCVLMGSATYFKVLDVATVSEHRQSLNEGFYGVGSEKALVNLNKLVAGNSSPHIIHFEGNLQVLCEDYPAIKNPTNNDVYITMVNGAEWSTEATSTVEIPQTGCNEGFNTKPNPPVNPSQDEFVIDPYTYSYMFEDQWPLYGDYDMNDIVIYVDTITKKYADLNAKTVNKMSFIFSLKAVGGTKVVAAALMLDKIEAGNVASVNYSDKTPESFATSGSGVESKQSKAVIPLFDNAHNFMGKPEKVMINTMKAGGNNVSDPPVVKVEVEFVNPVALDDLDVSFFNLFIISDIDLVGVRTDARKEVHVVGYQPTQRASTAYFGNNNDGSTSGKYYVSKDNLAWGITVPAAFRWPVEYMNILKAYEEFEGWVTSSGELNPLWWNNPSGSGSIY